MQCKYSNQHEIYLVFMDTLALHSRNRKKRSKQRAEYLQNQDDILSQESPSALQGRSRKEVGLCMRQLQGRSRKEGLCRRQLQGREGLSVCTRRLQGRSRKEEGLCTRQLQGRQEKKASVRDSYKADPEKKKASVRDSYNADIESKQSAKKQRYQEDVEENRVAKAIPNVIIVSRPPPASLYATRVMSPFCPLF